MKHSWQEWKDRLLDTFPPKKDFFARMKEVILRDKRAGESYADYYFDKIALINACRIVTGTDAVSCLIGGILDPSVRNSVRAARYRRPEELYEYLRELPNSHAPGTRQAHHTNVKRGNRPHHRNKGVNLRCHICKESGHKAAYCRKRTEVVCDYCKKAGHREDRCFKKNRSQPNAATL